MPKLGHKPWQAALVPGVHAKTKNILLTNRNQYFHICPIKTLYLIASQRQPQRQYGNNPQLFFVFHSPLSRTVARHQTNSYWTNNHIQSMYAVCFEHGTYSSVWLSIKLCLDILFVNVLSVLALFCASFATCCVSTHIPSHMRMNTYSKPYLRHATIIKYNLLHDCTPYCIWNFFLNCFGVFNTHCFCCVSQRFV